MAVVQDHRKYREAAQALQLRDVSGKPVGPPRGQAGQPAALRLGREGLGDFVGVGLCLRGSPQRTVVKDQKKSLPV